MSMIESNKESPEVAPAPGYPVPQHCDWVARDFGFHGGEYLPELKLHYQAIGNPKGEPVLILHGTAGSGAALLSEEFAGALFGPGQPLDASRYFLILPDSLGCGRSAKPSNGLRMNFPRYNYEDMVLAQYRLVTQGLGLKRLRAVIGYSMGGMQTWLWGSRYPGFADALVPMASTPAAMSGRNWMLRRMLTQSIRNDPDWQGGNYSAQPRGMQAHLLYFSLATAGGSLGWYGQAPSSTAGDQLIAAALAQPFSGDANDLLYQWESSFDFDPGPGLERIEAALLAINSADDERNPPELGLMQREIKRVRHGQYLLIPGGPATCGHASVLRAGLYKDRLAEFLQAAQRR